MKSKLTTVMPECAECKRLIKRNRQLNNQLITTKTKLRDSRVEVKKLKKHSEENRAGIFCHVLLIELCR